MKTNELRIGNWVYVPSFKYYNDEEDGFGKVKSINQDSIDVYPFKKLRYDKIEPIELTEDILTKIGFKKERQLISNLFYLDYETDVDTIIRVKYVIYPNRNSLPLLIITTSRYENYECCEFMNQGVKYLHELQNAYYCLTGKELEVEL